VTCSQGWSLTGRCGALGGVGMFDVLSVRDDVLK
jgi:hypothetical protein